MGVEWMNKKGLFFTIITLVLITSMIFLQTIEKKTNIESQRVAETLRLGVVSDKYLHIEKNIIILGKNGEKKRILGRAVPFNHYLDVNKLKISHELPFKDILINNFFDIINTYEILLEDKNFDNAYDGLTVDVNTVKNSSWGGTTTELRFLLNPYCYEYVVEDYNKSIFRKSSSQKCSNTFDFNKIKRIDVNVSVTNYYEDFNKISCSGFTTCPKQNFNDSNNQPFYNLWIDLNKCGNCNSIQQRILMHFNPLKDQNIVMSCAGTTCTSKPLIFVLGEGITVYTDSNKSKDLNIETLFTENIDEFIYRDFNFTIKDDLFKIIKTNNPENLN